MVLCARWQEQGVPCRRCRDQLAEDESLGTSSRGGHHVVAHNLSKQTDRSVLHSRRALDDDSQASYGGDGDRPSSESVDDVDRRHNHVAAGLAMVLAHNIWSGGALVVVVTLVGWITLIKSLFFLFLPPEMEAGLFLGQLHYRQLFYMYTAISLVLGVYLTYGGFKLRSN